MSELMKIEEVNDENLARIAAMIGQVDTSRHATQRFFQAAGR